VTTPSPSPTPDKTQHPRLLRGKARMREIAAEDAAKRQRLVAELGRPAGAVDRVSAETLAATVVRADRLRMNGRDDLEERRLVVQLQRALGLKPAPVERQKSNAATAGLRLLARGLRQRGRPMTTAPTILDLCDDRNVFGAWFKDRATWQAWFAFLAVLFGLPLTAEQLAIYQQCTGRQAAPSGPFFEAWLICGRRAGKSFVLALVAVFLSCFIDWSPYLVPGEVGRIIIIAADRRQSRVIFGYCLGFLEKIPMLNGMILRQTQDTIDLANGITIEIQAASFRTIRGYSLIACLADEAAFWSSDEGGANPDIEIIRSVRPALASIRGSMLLVASSPYAEAGALWNAYRRHHGKDGSPVLTWQAPTRTMNPSIPQALVDEAMESDPASASAEFMAQFRGDITNFIPRDKIASAVDVGITTRQPVRGVAYQCFFDAASGVGTDRFAAVWGHRANDQIIIDHVYVRRPPFDFSRVFGELACVCRNFNNVTEVYSDRYSIGALISECQRNGLTHKASDLDKSRLYLHALPQLTSGRVRLPDVPEIVNEFCSLERRVGSEGRDKVDARGGKPEDIANAVAGTIWLLSQPMSNADGWCEYMRREVEEPNSWNTDTDPVRAPSFGIDFTTTPLIALNVPAPIAADGFAVGPYSGHRYSLRRIGHQAICEMSHRDARELLAASPVWCALNPDAAKELGVMDEVKA